MKDIDINFPSRHGEWGVANNPPSIKLFKDIANLAYDVYYEEDADELNKLFDQCWKIPFLDEDNRKALYFTLVDRKVYRPEDLLAVGDLIREYKCNAFRMDSKVDLQKHADRLKEKLYEQD